MKVGEKKQANIDWFRNNLDRLVGDRLMHGKFVVVHNQSIVASHDTFEAALREALQTLPADEFAIQQVIGDSEVISFIRVAI